MNVRVIMKNHSLLIPRYFWNKKIFIFLPFESIKIVWFLSYLYLVFLNNLFVSKSLSQKYHQKSKNDI